ncbi:MAG: hypothetical protein RLZZ623_1000 [Actinomycetota bacterium]
MEVPERRDVAGSRTIRLWVAVVHGEGQAVDAVPSIYLTGGPGIAASTPFTSGAVDIAGEPTDVVVLDQRGVGRSEPHLACPELDAPLDGTHAWDERLAQGRDAALVCRSRFIEQGIDLNGYDTIESAADVVALRKALGYSSWTVTGMSYGGRLAREVYRQDPTGVAALVLDSAVTTAPSNPASLVQQADDAIAALATACAVQPACAKANGDVAANLAIAASRLDTVPYTVAATDGAAPITLAGTDLYDGAFSALSRTDLVPVLPAIAASLATGDNSALNAAVAELVQTAAADPRDDFATGAQDLIMCADEGGAFTDADRAALADPGRWATLLLRWGWAECDVWAVEPVAGGQLSAVSGSVPVLAVNGQLDPSTPPSFADEIRAQFPAATTLVYPGGGHGVLFMNDCATTIALAYYAHPAAHLDTSCVASMPQPFAG